MLTEFSGGSLLAKSREHLECGGVEESAERRFDGAEFEREEEAMS